MSDYVDKGYDLNLIPSKQTPNPDTSEDNSGLDKAGKNLKDKFGGGAKSGKTAASAAQTGTGADIAGGVGSTGAELGAGAEGAGAAGAGAAGAGAGAAGAGAAGAAAGGAAAGGAAAGLAELAPLIALAARGGIAKKPTLTMIGEKGPEAVLPLSDNERVAKILEKLGLRKGAEEARDMKCPTCGKPYPKKESMGDFSAERLRSLLKGNK